jgi:hypothetical protein
MKLLILNSNTTEYKVEFTAYHVSEIIKFIFKIAFISFLLLYKYSQDYNLLCMLDIYISKWTAADYYYALFAFSILHNSVPPPSLFNTT